MFKMGMLKPLGSECSTISPGCSSETRQEWKDIFYFPIRNRPKLVLVGNWNAVVLAQSLFPGCLFLERLWKNSDRWLGIPTETSGNLVLTPICVLMTHHHGGPCRHLEG